MPRDYECIIHLPTSLVGSMHKFMGDVCFSQKTEGIAKETLALRKYQDNIRGFRDYTNEGYIFIHLSFKSNEELITFFNQLKP